MSVLSASDFAPLTEFPLARRFAGAPFGHLTPEELARLRPLTPTAAARLAGEARTREAGVFPVSFRSDAPPATVRARLAALPPSLDERVLIAWNPRTAALADWALFVAHWDDFCYPAADDATVWPLTGAWTLCYRHYEVFQYRDEGTTP